MPPLKNEAQINKNNHATMPSTSKQGSLPNISLILHKIKIGPKSHIHALSAQKPSTATHHTWLTVLRLNLVTNNLLVYMNFMQQKIQCSAHEISDFP